MATQIFVNSISFNDGSTLTFGENDIVVFVGPNNAGKSASLKEINNILINKTTTDKIVLKDVNFTIKDKDKLIEFLNANSKKQTDSNSSISYQGLGYSLYISNFMYRWNDHENSGIGDIARVFTNILSTEERLIAANPPENIDFSIQGPSHPIHYLYRDDRIEKTFNTYFKQAFGKDLIVNRAAGKAIPLHVGMQPSIEPGEDRVSYSYIEKLGQLPMLHKQGDGMRSFVGVLLYTFIANYSITLIDEPEAFLHPPQARLLGKMLGKDLPNKRQLFLSTHSEYFLKGLLDSNNQNIKVVRLQRDGDINKVSVLDSSDINLIWNDSLLRHSNILDGLFHSKVIICESDSDSRFYSAIIDSIYDDTKNVGPDLLFIHSGGKHRIPVVVKALRKINVPISVITDFDVLNDTNPLKYIYEDLGGVWSDIEPDWRIVKNAIDAQRPQLETNEVKQEIDDIFSNIKDRILPNGVASNIQRTLKKASAWSKAKEVGKSFVPSGSQTQSYNNLIFRLNTVGLYVVEVGEVESFVKSVGNHGPTWVNDVLSKDLKNDPEFAVAKEFMLKVIG